MKIRYLARSGLLLCILAAACDRAPLATTPVPPSEPASLAQLECTVTVRTGALECVAPAPRLGGASGLIVGGPNGKYVHLVASGHTYSESDSVFSINVTVQNLVFQPLGAVNDGTADDAGVRVAFVEEPVATVMSPVGAPAEPVELVNAQRGMITGGNQAFFQYAGLLRSNAISESAQWRFKMPPAVDRFVFSVIVAAVVPHPQGVVRVTPAADTLAAAQTVPLSHQVIDAVGNAVADQDVTWSTSDPAVATVDAGGVVTGVGAGTAVITATQGARSGMATVAVCPSLALGTVFVAEMPAGSSFCLAGAPAAAGEYVIIPVNMDASPVSLGITGAGIVAASGAPTPALLPGGGQALRAAARLVPDDAWEARLRRLERSVPRQPASGSRIPGPRMAVTPGVPSVGALMSLNVETDNACSTNDLRTGRVVAVGNHVIVLADTMNPAGGLTAGDYAAIADSFDAHIHPVVTGAFGTPSDRDGNGRVIAFYTRAVNELTPPGSSAYVGGFFFARDLFPTPSFSCPTSNQGEMFYMLAADPAGAVNGNVRTASFVRGVTLGTLAHEYQHLVNASRRVLVNTPWNGHLEETWLDEGLAHVAEELVFYERAGLAPGGNVDVGALVGDPLVQAAFFKYGDANFARLRQWLLAPQSSGPFAAGDALATRGAAWAFLRYAADRRGGTQSTFWSALVNTGNTGRANLQAVLGTDPLPWFRDFTAATYADDAFGGTAPPAAYQQPSWDFRGIYSVLDYTGDGVADGYPLAVRSPTNGVTDSFTLAGGGAAVYARVGVPAGAFAGVTVRSGSDAPGATVRVAVVRRK
jgi:hypothetical protein